MKLVRFIHSAMQGSRLRYAGGILLVALQAVLVTLLSGELYRSVILLLEGADYLRSLQRLGFIFLALILLATLSTLGEILHKRASSETDVKLRSELLRHLLRLPVHLRSRQDQGYWLNLVGRDVNTLSAAYKSMGVTMGNMLIAALLGSIIVAFYSVPLALFAILAGALYFLSMNAVKQRMRSAEIKQQEALRQTTSTTSEMLQDLPTIRFYAMEAHFDEQLSRGQDAYAEAGAEAVKVQTAQVTLSSFGYAFAYVGSLAFALFLVSRDQLTLANAMFIWPTAMQVAYGIQRFGSLMIDLQAPQAAYEKIQETMDLPSEEAYLASLPTTPVTGPAPSPAPLIEFRQVSFAYPSLSGQIPRPVLQDLNLSVQRGEKLAILGQSGSGKSTLFKLLLRFYEPTSGRIWLGGEPITDLETADLREHFAYLPQFPRLFDGSVADNLRLVQDQADNAAIQVALERAQLTSLTGWDQAVPAVQVGIAGSHVSGGERQRIGLARAYLKGAPIYLLDEMTSALDAGLEADVMEALMQDEEATVILITHRSQSAEYADRVLLLDQGELREGTTR